MYHGTAGYRLYDIQKKSRGVPPAFSLSSSFEILNSVIGNLDLFLDHRHSFGEVVMLMNLSGQLLDLYPEGRFVNC